MAGPVASILLRSALAPADQSRIIADLTQLATHIDGDSFWLGDDHPFIVAFGEDYPGELDELDDTGLPSLLGWRPQGILTFIAMCNGDRDHELLAELCIRFAEQLDGLIDFGGQLRIGPDLGGASPFPPRRIDGPEGLPGVLYAAAYPTARGPYATSHCSDAAFLRAFLHHPRFRMVK